MSDSPIESVKWTEKTVVVEISGDIDLHRSVALQQGLLGLLDEKPQHVVIDLSAVPYMDSSGVASLVKLLSRTRKIGVDLTLVAPSPKVRSILEITRLDSIFKLTDSIEEAVG